MREFYLVLMFNTDRGGMVTYVLKNNRTQMTRIRQVFTD